MLFCLLFAVFFAFSVAVSTSNFGALVRLRIPQTPFLLCGLVIINGRQKEFAGSKKLFEKAAQLSSIE